MFDVVEMEERAGKVAGADVRLAADDELMAIALGIERVRSRLDVAEARVLAELERRDATDTNVGLSTKAWLARSADISPGAAADRVRKANQICRRLPKVADAVATGDLSFDHARALANAANPRVEAALADLEDEVIALAGELPFTRWLHQVRRLVELLDQDGPTPDVDLATNRLRFSSSLDGVTHVDGAMTADVSLAVRAAIDAKADEVYQRFAADHQTNPDQPIPPWATIRMLALAELLTGTTTGRAEVTLVLHDEQLTDVDGHPLPEAAAGVYGCDPDLWAVIVGGMGQPLDVGHARRFATYAQRRAIAMRDGGCAFPGCDQPMTRVDIHHLVSPLDGGRTAVDAMVALCRHHHVVTHRRGWSLAVDAEGTFTWTTPTGRTLTYRPSTRSPNHRRAGPLDVAPTATAHPRSAARPGDPAPR